MIKTFQFIFLITTLIFLNSCNNNNTLELEVLNSEVYAYCFDENCHKQSMYKNFEEYLELSKNKIKFKIQNNSNNTLILNSIKPIESIDKFPKRQKPLSLQNIILNNRDSEKINFVDINPDMTSYYYELQAIKDSITLSDYKNNGYNDDNFALENSEIIEDIIIIHPKETKYFEANISLPYNFEIDSKVEYFSLKSDEDYEMRLFFEAQAFNIDKKLTWSQLQTFKQNNYKFYEGELVSKNKIPVKVINQE